RAANRPPPRGARLGRWAGRARRIVLLHPSSRVARCRLKSSLRASLAKHVDAVGLWAGLGMFVVVVALGVASMLALVSSARWVDHPHQVIESLEALSQGLSDATSARRGFSLSYDATELDR